HTRGDQGAGQRDVASLDDRPEAASETSHLDGGQYGTAVLHGSTWRRHVAGTPRDTLSRRSTGFSLMEEAPMSPITKRSILVSAALLLTAGAAFIAGAASAGPGEKALAEVKEFTDRFNVVYESNDLKAYWEFYADDMTQYWEEGRLDIADYKKYWEKQIAAG